MKTKLLLENRKKKKLTRVKSGFEIERSIDGRNYERIGIVAASATSIGINNYQFTWSRISPLGCAGDLLPQAQAEYAGWKIYYSRIVALATDSSEYCSVLPEPCNRLCKPAGNNRKGTGFGKCRIVDNNGKLVKQLLWNITPNPSFRPISATLHPELITWIAG